MPLNERHFRLLTENSMVGVYIIDDRKKFRYVNPALARMLGYTRDELIGKMSFLNLIFPDDIPVVLNNFKQRICGHVTNAHYETRAVHKLGHVVHIEIFGTSIDPAEQKTIIGTVIDITARKQAEENALHHQMELELLNQTLERRIADEVAKNCEKDHMMMQQSRFAAMGEMVASIAHQWRQPLNKVGMAIQSVQHAFDRGSLTPDFIHRQTANALEVLMYMSQTIDDFRNFFRPEKDPRRFKLGEAVDKVVELFKSNEHRITITTVIHRDTTINGHMNELTQVLLNILNNARDVLLERKCENPTIQVELSAESNCSIITVKDNGGGIPHSIIARIFDPFFTTKEIVNGSGLGLYMAKTIVEKSMKGTISARNHDAGAELRIELPLPQVANDN